jgi:hypothetical protein
VGSGAIRRRSREMATNGSVWERDSNRKVDKMAPMGDFRPKVVMKNSNWVPIRTWLLTGFGEG